MNFSLNKISHIIRYWWHGQLSTAEAERMIILHHNKSKIGRR